MEAQIPEHSVGIAVCLTANVILCQGPEELVRLAALYAAPAILVLGPGQLVTTGNPHAQFRFPGASQQRPSSQFCFPHEGLLVVCNAWNYRTLADLVEGKRRGFAYGEEYYAARDAGFEDASTYEDARARGYTDHATYRKATEADYKGAMERYNSLQVDEYLQKRPPKPEMSSEARLYFAVEQGGFAGIDELLDATKKGFSDAATYRTAVARGFCHALQYQAAVKGGFGSPEELEAALADGFAHRAEHVFFSKLSLVQREWDLKSMQEAHVVALLDAMSVGERFEAASLWSALQEAKTTLGGKARGTFERWYTRTLRGPDELDLFLRDSRCAAEMGIRPVGNGAFVKVAVEPLSRTVIVVDASNVAWAGGPRAAADRASAANLICVLDELQKRGYTRVVAIADASLQHDIDSPEVLDELIHSGRVHEVPSGTPADEYILQKAERENARIVSNDRYADWTSEEPAVAAHVLRARVSFLIVDGSVEFSPRIP